MVSLKVARGPLRAISRFRFAPLRLARHFFRAFVEQLRKLRSRGKEPLPLCVTAAISLLSFFLPLSRFPLFPSCVICSVGRSRRGEIECAILPLGITHASLWFPYEAESEEAARERRKEQRGDEDDDDVVDNDDDDEGGGGGGGGVGRAIPK